MAWIISKELYAYFLKKNTELRICPKFSPTFKGGKLSFGFFFSFYHSLQKFFISVTLLWIRLFNFFYSEFNKINNSCWIINFHISFSITSKFILIEFFFRFYLFFILFTTFLLRLIILIWLIFYWLFFLF